ncbi:hypothetical protein PUN28_015476 [Cardiocondyla obscurior]|uniref:Uncharacterized protein n=1 Tax=Cardiocondyla obscurior TaxID=286306 RepID=A0AAW2ET95_9HYME
MEHTRHLIPAIDFKSRAYNVSSRENCSRERFLNAAIKEDKKHAHSILSVYLAGSTSLRYCGAFSTRGSITRVINLCIPFAKTRSIPHFGVPYTLRSADLREFAPPRGFRFPINIFENISRIASLLVLPAT